MERQEKATIQLECQQLLNRATMLLDNGQWQELANCYTDDAVLFRPSDSGNGIEGRAAIYESFYTRPSRTSCHILANSVCEVITKEKVVANSRVWLVTGEAGDTFPVKADSKLMIGSFEDILVRIGDEWLIQLRRGGIELKYSCQ